MHMLWLITGVSSMAVIFIPSNLGTIDVLLILESDT
jgi:hypothetical protein